MSDQQPEFPQIPKNATLLYDEHGNIYGYSVKPSLWDKCKKEPLVPIGALITVLALTKGIAAFRRGDSKTSQRMMRYRVLAQASTIGLVAFYSYHATTGSKTNQSKLEPPVYAEKQ